MNKQINVSDFSNYLFWDVIMSELDIDANRNLIIKRTLELGQMRDWELIIQLYGIREIGRVAVTFKSLNPKALNFIATICDIPLNEFKCCIMKQSISRHWIY